ncbi:MAG: branched-chain amino acid ABC transporter permease [Halobacteriales archaeon]
MFSDLLGRHDASGRQDEAIGTTGRRMLLALVVVLVLVAPLLQLLEPFYLFLLTEVLIFALLALALDFVFGYCGLPSFGHAAMFGSGGYAAALLLVGGVQNPVVVLPVTFIVGVIVAAVIGWLSVRSKGVYFAMLTLAFAQVLFIIAFNDLVAVAIGVEQVTRGDNGIYGFPGYELLGLNFGSRLVYYYLTLALSAASIGILLRLANSPFGRVIQGIRENEDRIEALGYDMNRYKVVAFSLSGGFTGLAGGLFVPLQTIAHPSLLDWTLSGELIVMVLLGGMGSLWGPMLGATVVVLLEDLLSSIEGWRLVLGGLFVTVVIFAPEGIAGMVRTVRRNPRTAFATVRRTLREYARNVRR